MSFHETKCAEIRDLENVNNVVNQQQKSKPPPQINEPLTVRKLSPTKSKSTSSSAKSTGPLKPAPQQQQMKLDQTQQMKLDQTLLMFNTDGARPGTMTLRGRSSSVDTAQRFNVLPDTAGPVGMTRVCYICGQRFGRNSLEVHEKKCLHFWHCVISKLPNFVQSHEPKKLPFQSVDGTVDYDRVDLMAQQTAMQAQRVECGRCKKSVPLSDAKDHVMNCKPKPPKNSKKKSPFDRDFYITMF